MEATALALPHLFPLRRRSPAIPTPKWTRPQTSSTAFRSSTLRFKAERGGICHRKGRHELLPKEFYDHEWQAQQRKTTKEWHAYCRAEEKRENKIVDEYRAIGMRHKGYPEEEVRKARQLVSSFIRSVDEVEEKIEEAAEKGELIELVLMVIWNRLDLACKDTEILKGESTPSFHEAAERDLLNLHDGFDDEGWLKKCRNLMVETFPREDPFSMLVPTGLDVDSHQGRIGLPPTDDDVLLRADFIREVDALLQGVRADQSAVQPPQEFDAESVATRLKQQEKQRTCI